MSMSSPRTWAALVLAALAAVTVPAPAAHACAPYQIVTVPLGTQTEVSADGGLLMAQVHGRGGDEGEIVVEAGGKPVAYEDIYLAAGLELFRIKAAPGTALTLRAGKAVATVAVVASRGALRAPAVRSARSAMRRPAPSRTAGPSMGSPSTVLSIALARPLPDDAVALIVYGRADYGLGWAPVERGVTTFEIAGGGKGCGGGFGSIYAGDRLSFAWVDARGRVSARSAVRPVALAR